MIFLMLSTVSDSGPGSLRDAITNACDGDTILFLLNEGILFLDNMNFTGNMEGAAPKAWTNHHEIYIKQGSSYIKSICY